MEDLQWILVNADRISVVGLLVLVIVALQRQWLVLGWAHQECIKDRDKFEAKVEAIAKSNEDKIAFMEREVAMMRDELGRMR